MIALENQARQAARSRLRVAAGRRLVRRHADVRRAARQGRGAFLLAVARWREAADLYRSLERR